MRPIGSQAIIRGQITEAEREQSVLGRLGGAPVPRGGPSANVRPRLADAEAMPHCSGQIVRTDLHESIWDVEERLVMVELAVGAHEAEPGPDEGPLRSDVVQSRVGDHPGQSMVGGHGQQGDDRLRGVAVAAGRRSQAVADLDAATLWLPLKPIPPTARPSARRVIR